MAKKTTLDDLKRLVSTGFAKADRKFAALAEDIAAAGERMATKDDLEVLDKKLSAQLDGVKSKVDGINRRLDTEANARTDEKLSKRVIDLETEVFGKSRARQHPAR